MLGSGLSTEFVAALAKEVEFHLEAGVRFSYKTMHAYLRSEFNATPKEAAQGYAQAMQGPREAQAIARQKQVGAGLREAIATGEKPVKAPPVQHTPEWMRLNEENAALRGQVNEIGGPKTPEEVQALRNERAVNAQRRIGEKLREGIATGTAPAKIPPRRYTNEWVKAHRENVELRAQLTAQTSPNKSLGRRMYETVLSFGNAPMGFLAAWDDSFVGRQGLLMLAHGWGRKRDGRGRKLGRRASKQVWRHWGTRAGPTRSKQR
jgi:hypothetical protein